MARVFNFIVGLLLLSGIIKGRPTQARFVSNNKHNAAKTSSENVAENESRSGYTVYSSYGNGIDEWGRKSIDALAEALALAHIKLGSPYAWGGSLNQAQPHTVPYGWGGNAYDAELQPGPYREIRDRLPDLYQPQSVEQKKWRGNTPVRVYNGGASLTEILNSDQTHTSGQVNWGNTPIGDSFPKAVILTQSPVSGHKGWAATTLVGVYDGVGSSLPGDFNPTQGQSTKHIVWSSNAPIVLSGGATTSFAGTYTRPQRPTSGHGGWNGNAVNTVSQIGTPHTEMRGRLINSWTQAPGAKYGEWDHSANEPFIQVQIQKDLKESTGDALAQYPASNSEHGHWHGRWTDDTTQAKAQSEEYYNPDSLANIQFKLLSAHDSENLNPSYYGEHEDSSADELPKPQDETSSDHATVTAPQGKVQSEVVRERNGNTRGSAQVQRQNTQNRIWGGVNAKITDATKNSEAYLRTLKNSANVLDQHSAPEQVQIARCRKPACRGHHAHVHFHGRIYRK